MKRWVSIAVILILICQTFSGCSGVIRTMSHSDKPEFYEENGISYGFRTKGKSYQVYNGEDFEDIYITGVNIGAGEPNLFPGELTIPQSDYLTWFEQIADLGVNSIRVYTVLKPAFYDAFYKYNMSHDKELYLFQGVWYDEDIIIETADAYTTMDRVKKDLVDLVDIIHGDAYVERETGHGYGEYTKDISRWVAGWILGIESDQTLVEGTEKAHPNLRSYSGNYLSCDKVNPYEVFWCEIGDFVLKYETEKYKMQRPVSYSNWATADVFTHPNEPLEQEDAISLTVENIKPTDNFYCGMFASYHIYPYYPNFIFKEEPYISYRDPEGNINPYRAYIEQLANYHTVPLIIAEFGVPVSRGVTHVNPITGYNQGGHTDQAQGEIIVSMFKDIKDVGCAGAMVFTWQDEWFKRTWNTEMATNSNYRAYWNDVETCEQHFGILEFISAELSRPVILDGEDGDWRGVDTIYDYNGITMKVQNDSTYLYVLLKGDNLDFDDGQNYLCFDINPDVGCNTYQGTSLNGNIDYVLDIKGQDETRLMVEKSSDSYMLAMAAEDVGKVNLGEGATDTFHREYMVLDRALLYPQTKEQASVQLWETGIMLFASNNERAEDYNYLADFYYKNGTFEIRIPWGLLGFSAPNCKEINLPYRANTGLAFKKIENFKIGLCTEGEALELVTYDWEPWEFAKYTQRLRKSYYIIQDYLKNEN